MTGTLDHRHPAAGDLAAAILDSAHALVVTLDIEGRITSFNRACELLTGYKANEVIGTYLWDRLLPEEVIEPVQQIFASLPEGGEIPEEHENAWVARNGNRPIIAWNNSVVRNAAGNIELIVGIGVDITERKATSDRLARAQRIAGIGNWEWTIETNEEYWSDQFFRNLGLEPGSVKLSGSKFYEYVHPDDREMLQHAVQQALETKQPYNIDFRVIWPDGTERLAHEEAEAILDSAGKAVALTGTMQDVTELREKEDRLQRLTTRLEYAQRTARIGNWEWDAATGRQWWSDEGYRIVGYEPGEVEASDESFFSVVHRDDIVVAKEISYAAERTGEAYEFTCRVYLRDGTERIVREVGHPAYDDNGNYIGQNGTFQDITERHAAEQKLAETAARLEAATRLARLGSWEWDPQSNILRISEETRRICGLAPDHEEIDNDLITAMIPEEDQDRVTSLLNAAVSRGESYTHEHSLIWPSGEIRWLLEQAEPLYDENTGKTRVIGTVQDITERKAAEQELLDLTHSLTEAQRIAHIGNWFWDSANDDLVWSDETCRIFGYAPGKATLDYDQFISRVHPDDREKVDAAVEGGRNQQQPYDVIFRIIRPNGEERVVHESGEYALDAQGRFIGMAGTVQDITEQHAAQRDLAETAQRLGAAMHLARIGSWEWDPESSRLKMSDETLHICGLGPEHGEVDNEFLMAMIPAEEQARILDLMDHAAFHGEPYTNEYHIVRPNGDRRTVIENGTAFHDDRTGRVKLIGTIQDITERKLVEEELARTVKRLDDAQTAARIGNWEWDAETNRDWWSEQQFRNYGIEAPAGFVPGDNFLQFAHPADREAARQAVDRSAETGTPLDMEYRAIGADGVERMLWVYGVTENDTDGRVIRTVGTTQDITIRKRAELALALNVQRLDISQEAALIGSWEWNLDTGEVWWSDQQYRNYGAEPGSLKLSVKSFIQYLHPADQDAVKAGIERIVTDGAAFDQEYRVVGRDGVQRVLWGHGIAERDKKGKTIRLVGTTLDITVRKDAEWQLAIMAEDLKNAQRIANIGSWEWNILTNEEHWSDQNYRVYGLEPGSIQPNGDSFLDYVHPEDRAMLLTAQDTAIAGGQPLEIDYRSIGADGVERLIHTSAEVERDSKGNAVRLAGTVQDITERKHIEQALQESEARLRGIFDHASVGIGLSNLQAELIEVNQQFADFLGYSIHEMVGLTFRDFTHPDYIKISGEQFDALLAGDVTKISHEKQYIRRDGTAIWGLRTLSLIDGEAGMPKYMVVIVKDIDDRKRAETDLARATERLEEAQRIANIGHWNWLPDSSNTIWSDEIYRIFGLERGAIHPTHDTFFEMVHEDDRETIAALMNETIESGEPYETEFRIIRADGAMRHIFERGERYIDEQTGEASIRGIMQDITERKAVEEKLRETAENLNKSQRIAKLGSWVWEIEEDKEWWSDEIYRFLGMQVGPEVVGGYNFLEYVHPDDRERVSAALDKSLKEGVPYVAEYRIQYGEGPVIIVSEHAETEYDTAGKPVRMRGTSQDITERKQVEQALQESETRLDAFFNEAPVGLAILDSEYRYVKVNETLAQINGAPIETHVGKHPSEFMAPERAELIDNLLRRTLEHGESIDREESIVLDADGGNRYRVYTQFPLSGDPRKPDTVGVVVVDITDLKQAELVLQQTMERLEEAQRIGQMGSWTWDPEEDTEWWSDQHYRILGLEPGSITLSGFDFLKYVHPDDHARVDKIERKAVENRTPFSVEYRVIRPDGIERIVSEYGEWNLDGLSGKPIWRGVVHDITERKRIEQELSRLNAELELRVEERTAELRAAQGELVKSERLATLGQLTATVSHELRNPLGAMRTSMYVVEKKTDADDQRLKASIDRVNRNITRCDQIIDELLDYTRIRDLVTQQTNIDSWLGAVLAEQTVQDDITVKRKFGAAGAQAPADTDRLRRAFINIFENACQAAANPRVKDEPPRKPLVTVETRLLKDRLEILVSDNGPGVPAEIREKIFEPLFSTKNFGVGLGLPTVSQIMKQHGGGVSVREKRGGGAKFALWLPLAGELEIADT